MEQEEYEDNPSPQTLERTFERAPTFFEAAAEVEEIFAALTTKGYSQAVHEAGWHAYLASRRQYVPVILKVPSTPAAKAINVLDVWDGPAFELTDATLRRAHPVQFKHVMQGLSATTGIGAVLNARTWLERVGQLENDPTREATREEDHKALAALEEVGLGAEERERLWSLVRQAESASAPSPETLAAVARREAAEAERRLALISLYNWFYKWSRIARAVVTKRSHLIRMGLAAPTPRSPRTTA